MSAAAQTKDVKGPIKETNGEGWVEIHAFAFHNIKGGMGGRDRREEDIKGRIKTPKASSWKKLCTDVLENTP